MTNPYLDNRRQYSAVLESAASNAKGWRMATLMSLLISLISAGGVVYIGSLSKLVPVVIEVDGYGQPMRLYAVNEHATTQDDRIIKAALAQVITWARSVSIDASYEKKVLNNMVHYFERGSAAFARVQEYLRADETNPFKRAATQLVSTQINNAIKITDHSWQIDWTETVRERSGKPISIQKYKATVTLGKAKTLTEEALYVNPTGILIKDLQWGELINQ